MPWFSSSDPGNLTTYSHKRLWTKKKTKRLCWSKSPVHSLSLSQFLNLTCVMLTAFQRKELQSDWRYRWRPLAMPQVTVMKGSIILQCFSIRCRLSRRNIVAWAWMRAQNQLINHGHPIRESKQWSAFLSENSGSGVGADVNLSASSQHRKK